MSSFDTQLHPEDLPEFEAYQEQLDFEDMEAMDDEPWDEDDGQPSEYDEWQDVYGGDDWDHGQFPDDFDSF